MDHERHSNDMKQLRARNRDLGLGVAALGAGLLIALLVILKIVGSERTVVVPPSINKSFWVTGDRGSNDYLNQMAAYVAYLILDVDKDVVDWKTETLLGWVEPSQHAAFKTRMSLEADRLKRIGASTFFKPQQLVPNEERQTVILRGRLRTDVNGQETSNDTKTYLAEFDFLGGRAQLKSFKEIPNETVPGASTSVSTASR